MAIKYMLLNWNGVRRACGDLVVIVPDRSRGGVYNPNKGRKWSELATPSVSLYQLSYDDYTLTTLYIVSEWISGRIRWRSKGFSTRYQMP